MLLFLLFFFVIRFFTRSLFYALFYFFKRNVTFFFAKLYVYTDMFVRFLWERHTNVFTCLVYGSIYPLSRMYVRLAPTAD